MTLARGDGAGGSLSAVRAADSDDRAETRDQALLLRGMSGEVRHPPRAGRGRGTHAPSHGGRGAAEPGPVAVEANGSDRDRERGFGRYPARPSGVEGGSGARCGLTHARTLVLPQSDEVLRP